MIRISNIKVPLNNDTAMLHTLAARHLKLAQENVLCVHIFKKSVDARKKHDICFVMTLDVSVQGDEAQIIANSGDKQALLPAPYAPLPLPKPLRLPSLRPVVVGSGPAGLFAALTLARAGLRPVVIERGGSVETRKNAVDSFFRGGAFSPSSNVQFGEGGAGTFSDGKLTTGIKDPRCREVLHTFAKHGAPEEILHSAKPHIGTDYLLRVVRSIRKEIIALGGEVRFETTLTDLVVKDGTLCAIVVQGENGIEELPADTLVLAIGHSARDTFTMLHERGAQMQQKSFSIGARIEHPQARINESQYGKFAAHPALGAADYKLSTHLSDGRGVYTFCMCPGGVVVAAASEEGGIVTNGMSLYARDGENANSALLVSVTPQDFESEHPLAGMNFQRKWEQSAYNATGKTYRAPAQLVGDFLQNRESHGARSVLPSYHPGVTWGDLRCCLPPFAITSMQEALLGMDRRLSGFALPDAVLTGPETRSSSPVRILRGEDGQSTTIAGLYPAGEGAGYAGGIMSAAVDGLRLAQNILAKYM